MLVSRKSSRDVDAVARMLAMLGQQAAAMPPAYLGAEVHEPVFLPGSIGRSGACELGRVLDGRGLLLHEDLRSIGITKPIPHVYERTPARRLFDKLGDERAAITTYDGIINARGAGNYYDAIWGKQSITTVANAWSTTFMAAGMPAAGTYTTIPTGAAFNSASVGGLFLGFPNPGGNSAYLASVGCSAAQQVNCFLFADLLVGCGSIALTSNTTQTVSSTALTRYTTGAGVYMTFEITTAAGSTAQNLTATYTNQAGTGSQSTGAQTLTASAIVHRCVPVGIGLPMQLASGDYGVRAVASVICSAANSAGVVGLNLFKPLAFLPGLVANVYGEKDTTITIDSLVGLPVDGGGAVGCPIIYVLPNTTSTGIMSPVLRGIWG